jgi:Rieske 2Fe-2S family protein
MDQDRTVTPDLPLLASATPALPAAWYFDAGQFAREMEAIWLRSWVYAGRAAEIAPGQWRTTTIAGQTVLMVRDHDGALRAFHNTCRHRGAELCPQGGGTLGSKLIVCRYHAWGYGLDGALKRTANGRCAADFDAGAHALLPVAMAEWRGCVFVNLGGGDVPLQTIFDPGPQLLANWPLERLVAGHRSTRTIACNWKIFWENYNECLHCPGVHPLLCETVPIYGRGIMGAFDDADAAAHAGSDDPRHRGGLRQGAQTWSMSGRPCPPGFPALTGAERQAGHTFLTALPGCFIVAHVDYVRVVSMRPLGPELTELTAEWLFLPETLADPAFDLHDIVEFASTVMAEDADACEINQRGLKAAGFGHGTLMPEEYELKRLHDWVRGRLNGTERETAG